MSDNQSHHSLSDVDINELNPDYMRQEQGKWKKRTSDISVAQMNEILNENVKPQPDDFQNYMTDGLHALNQFHRTVNKDEQTMLIQRPLLPNAHKLPSTHPSYYMNLLKPPKKQKKTNYNSAFIPPQMMNYRMGQQSMMNGGYTHYPVPRIPMRNYSILKGKANYFSHLSMRSAAHTTFLGNKCIIDPLDRNPQVSFYGQSMFSKSSHRHEKLPPP